MSRTRKLSIALFENEMKLKKSNYNLNNILNGKMFLSLSNEFYI